MCPQSKDLSSAGISASIPLLTMTLTAYTWPKVGPMKGQSLSLCILLILFITVSAGPALAWVGAWLPGKPLPIPTLALLEQG